MDKNRVITVVPINHLKVREHNIRTRKFLIMQQFTPNFGFSVELLRVGIVKSDAYQAEKLRQT